MYSADSLTLQLAGLVQDDDVGDDLDYAIGGGATIGIADGFQITAGAVFGEGTNSYANNISPLTADEEFWGASVGLIASLSEDTRLELGVGYEDYDNAGDALGFGGGVYWDPVSQVTLGIGATYIERTHLQSVGIDAEFFEEETRLHVEFVDEDDADSLEIFFGTWLRFP